MNGLSQIRCRPGRRMRPIEMLNIGAKRNQCIQHSAVHRLRKLLLAIRLNGVVERNESIHDTAPPHPVGHYSLSTNQRPSIDTLNPCLCPTFESPSAINLKKFNMVCVLPLGKIPYTQDSPIS